MTNKQIDIQSEKQKSSETHESVNRSVLIKMSKEIQRLRGRKRKRDGDEHSEQRQEKIE